MNVNKSVDVQVEATTGEVEHPEVISDIEIDNKAVETPLQELEWYEGQFDAAAATDEELNEYLKHRKMGKDSKAILEILLSDEGEGDVILPNEEEYVEDEAIQEEGTEEEIAAFEQILKEVTTQEDGPEELIDPGSILSIDINWDVTTTEHTNVSTEVRGQIILPIEDDTTEVVYEERDDLLKKIDDFYSLLDMPTMGRNFELMDNASLKDHLYLLNTNNGGSFSVAEKLQETEIEYDRLLKSDVLRLRMDLIEHKGADVIVLMQKMRKIIGNDFVINNVRAGDYHNMLKSAISFISVMHDKVSELGNRLGIKMPLSELKVRGESIPVIEGMPADPRIAMYVLNVMISYIDKFQILTETSNKQIERNKTRIAFLEAREKHLDSLNETHRKYAQDLAEQLDRFTADSSYWIIKDQHGNMLRVIDPDIKPTNVRDLDLRGDYDTALQFLNKTGARTWADRLMATRRFKNRQLAIYRVSVVEDK